MTQRSQILFENADMQWYLHHEALSSSQIKAARKSHGHYLAAIHGSGWMTDAQRMGTAFHTRILEPHKFLKEFPICRAEGDARKKAENGGCKEALDAAKVLAKERGFLCTKMFNTALMEELV